MRRSEYFTISHYLPEGVYQRNREMKRYLRNSHFSKRGMHSRDAEQTFIRYVQGMREYGQHLYSAIWVHDQFHIFIFIYGLMKILHVCSFLYFYPSNPSSDPVASSV